MLLNFQKQFAVPVATGAKRQTIRSMAKRVHVPKVGDVAHCYTGLRTRHARLLGKWPIQRVVVVRFQMESDTIVHAVVGSDCLNRSALSQLALADGFESLRAMESWFGATHGNGDFEGWLIGWDFSQAGQGPGW